MQKLEDRASDLEIENTTLENQIAKEGSLNIISDKANKMGFKKIERIEYIK